jgi:hypothetical protein
LVIFFYLSYGAFSISVKIKPFLKMRTVPLDSEMVIATASVTAVIPAAAT